MRRLLIVQLVWAIFWFAAASSASADEPICGTAPALPTTADSDERIKGQLQGQADFLSKLVGNAELGGQVEAARKTIYQTSDKFFAAQKDAYLAYMFCVIVMQDKSLTTKDKLDAIKQYRGAQEKSSSNNTTPRTDNTAETQPSPPPRLDRTISFDCFDSERPTHSRSDRTLYIARISGPQGDISAVQMSSSVTLFIQGDFEIKWDKSDPTQFSKCIIRNHGKLDLFNVSVDLFVDWRNVLKTNNGVKSGGSVISGAIRSPPLDVNARGEDYFYVANWSDLFVQINTPERVMFVTADSEVPKTASLIPSTSHISYVFFVPRTPVINPPVAHLPTLGPPNRPKAK